MGIVITTASTVLCDKAVTGPAPLHGGTVSVSSPGKLTVKGNGVLLKSGVGPDISGCTTPDATSPTTSPCKTVSSVTRGEALKLTVAGKGVLTDSLFGVTSGVPAGTLPATAEHAILTAS
jgi:hypothetical protein